MMKILKYIIALLYGKENKYKVIYTKNNKILTKNVTARSYDQVHNKYKNAIDISQVIK